MNEQDKAAFEEWWTTANTRLTDIPKAQAIYIYASMLAHRDKQAAQAEPVAWQFYDEASEKWCNGLEVNNHRKNTEAAGIKTRDLFPNSPADVVRELVETLQWYQEQARLSRLIHSEGDAGRNALANDGGNRAKEALTKAKEHGL